MQAMEEQTTSKMIKRLGECMDKRFDRLDADIRELRADQKATERELRTELKETALELRTKIKERG